jgi:hypothetical protein
MTFHAVSGLHLPPPRRYHLRAVLPAHMHSIYAIFGDMHNPPHVPAAWMSTDPAADPLAAKATANPLLYGFFPELEFTSYLLLGSLDVDTATTPGGDSSWRQWDAATPLTLGVAPGNQTHTTPHTYPLTMIHILTVFVGAQAQWMTSRCSTCIMAGASIF